ncbi:MAG: hypothetical protein IM624_13180 [Phenylobacterium sp.]|uniref:hypothetical protein n=1 Tax=Phenylobacterium sp. TaxID=1871053 RepID=UPI0025DE0A0F|nr:hypothetical protein [Phenylobacterium sp.]MCA6300141.1 hypothetical protein [Phenylobacterium sp.]
MNTLKIIGTIALRTAKPHGARSKLLFAYGVGLVVLLVLLTLARACLFTLDHYWSGLLDNLSAGVLLAFIALVWYRLLSPPESFKEDLQVIDAWNIGPKLDDALKDTEAYWFRGRSARWFRAKALPRLAEAAQRDQVARHVHLILPDPANQDVLNLYASHRNSLPDAGQDPWDSDRIRNEILATILVAGQTAAGNRLLKVHVFVLPEFSLFRYDLSDTGVVLTREDKRWPGWFSPAGTKFYTSVQEDLRIASERGQIINLGKAEWSTGALSLTTIPTLVKQLGFAIALNSTDVRSVLKAANSRANPYV